VSDLYIGLMSGTSMDGIDAALVRFNHSSLDILHTAQHLYPGPLREQLLAARMDASLRSPDDVPDLHRQVGTAFCDAAVTLLESAGVRADAVDAIGSHGQTLRHAPDASPPFSLQIGDPDIIAAGTGITTIADFRRRDIELGGQGAPLAPAFHEWLFRSGNATRVVLNIGGIANISKQGLAAYDADGDWGASGNVIEELLAHLLADPYFATPAPKSTGFEYFNLDWLTPLLTDEYDATDIQTTLCQLTAQTIADAVRSAAPEAADVLVCGGGIHNRDLMRRLAAALPGTKLESTAAAGLDPDWVEAAAFAWLAMRTRQGMPGNLPSVTGASGPAVLGSEHPPS
jgi:anhydro-N-acetylmuramic acid kinase